MRYVASNWACHHTYVLVVSFLASSAAFGDSRTQGTIVEDLYSTRSTTADRDQGDLARWAEWQNRKSDEILEHEATPIAGGGGPMFDMAVFSTSNGSNMILVEPGETVDYKVRFVLEDDANQGLALLGFDLVFDGGDLNHVDIPTGEPTPGCDNPSINFARPWGITNPDSPCPSSCGFGGTIINGNLIQVGGGQNTILNTEENAPFPIGPVLLGVGHPSGCGEVSFAKGSLVAPSIPGIYTLAIEEPFANVIRADATGEPFYATESASPRTIVPLTIEVGAAVPAVSDWGAVILVLLMSCAGCVSFRRLPL